MTFRSVFPPLEMLSGILEFFDQRHIDRINAEVSIIADGLGYQDIMIPGHNINRLLETQGLYEIDYCSIDTEGAEVNIVKSIDFNKIRIGTFSIENNDTAGELRNYLSSFGYARYTLGSDDLISKESIAGLWLNMCNISILKFVQGQRRRHCIENILGNKVHIGCWFVL